MKLKINYRKAFIGTLFICLILVPVSVYTIYAQVTDSFPFPKPLTIILTFPEALSIIDIESIVPQVSGDHWASITISVKNKDPENAYNALVTVQLTGAGDPHGSSTTFLSANTANIDCLVPLDPWSASISEVSAGSIDISLSLA